MSDVATIALALCVYPAMVLLVALTGPHNETERRELASYRAEKRRQSLTKGENA